MKVDVSDTQNAGDVYDYSMIRQTRRSGSDVSNRLSYVE